MKVYAFSGLGADQRIFSYLNLEHEIVPIRWETPLLEETIESYAVRLAGQIETSEPFAMLGVSFGGMLVSELMDRLSPQHAILISSAACKYELPWLASVAQRLNLVKHLPTGLFKPPMLGAYIGFPFNKRNRDVARGIIQDTDPGFVKWAVHAIVNWKKEVPPESFHHIHGRLDPILPWKNRMNAQRVGTGHFIILKNAKEVSKILNEYLAARP